MLINNLELRRKNYLDQQQATGMSCQQIEPPFHQEQHQRPSDHEKNPIFAVQAE
jgi:hypothetical protein